MSACVANRPPGRLRAGLPTTQVGRRSLALHLGGIAALALILVAADAFGSDDLSFGRRALMFGIVSFLLVAQASLLADAMRRFGRRLGPAPAAVAAVIATLLLMTVEIHWLKATPVVPYAPDPLPEFALFLMPFVVPVSGFVVGLKWATGRAGGDRSVERRGGARPPPAGSSSPDWPAQGLRRVRALDHYLELHTATGTKLVRGRMDDALRRVLPGAGIRVHRSWWVARAEIDRLERRGRDHVLRLRDGEAVPVARGRVHAVRRFLEPPSVEQPER